MALGRHFHSPLKPTRQYLPTPCVRPRWQHTGICPTKVLLTRGMRGVSNYSTDPETHSLLESLVPTIPSQ
ncbi:MAG TPA: hypothetical protein VKA58_04670 [Propionibacteriaceae bacterium]|nr:hypothetical protein [Propionibacteriaceae bacterium]